MARSRLVPAVAAGAALVLGVTALSAAPADAGRGGPDRPPRWVQETLHQMSLEQKVGQLFVPYVTGATADTASPENLERFGVATPAEAVRELHLGGVIYFAWSDNTQDPEQIARLSNGLQEAALERGGRSTGKDRGPAIPLTIATDQETGLVARVGPPATQFPGAMALGAGRDLRATRDTYGITGTELRAVGINADYAPDADVNVNPANPIIGVRSFSSRPALVADHVTAAVRGLQFDGEVSAVAKHFPGHGDTGTDSHSELPVITHTRAQWEQVDAPPFKAAIAAGVDSIMTAHISFPVLEPNGDPSTLSRKVLTGLLREELGYQGVIATDSLRMAGVRAKYSDAEIAIRAVEAGADVLLDPQQPVVQYQAVLDAVRSGRLTEQRLDESVRRILAMKYRRGVVQDPLVEVQRVARTVGTAAHLARAQQITDGTPTLVTDDADLVPLPSGSTLVTGSSATGVPLLAGKLAARGHRAEGFTTGSAPADATIAAAVTRAATHDTVVVMTSSATKDPAQQELVAALQRTGKPVLVVAVGHPYDISVLPGVPSYLVTCSTTPVALESLARLLDGAITPQGTLPVDIPSATDPGTVLHPFGTGLTS
ncbi:beta-N-acetylhexosaminidase [Friedmanniella luteola]|uniref:beta-N-acetylhexosaminidase n=1 Tax=Friedmanniella luteola TaxID=546871 RepID=A0A1H1W468_9ACTN|nr:glycoside hydrolase family 3 protein [Friedmanniella luteola]SDS91863.1 beta-N-acetylhexosaminidase [Friedmanniella luteola]